MRDPAGLRVAVALHGSASGTVTVDCATADEGLEPPLSEAADQLVGPFADVGEPEGLRRADGGPVPERDVGDDHNGTPLRQKYTAAGVWGLRPRPPAVLAAAREAGGSKGAQPPTPELSV